jgi:protein-tyrosine phosphatase
MTDIHSHIVWGVDDGPPSIEESLVMLGVAASSGTTDIVATPHANPKYPFQRELVLERIQALTEAGTGTPRIHFGCEFHLSFDNIDHLMDNLRQYTINQKQYLLVECPDFHIGQHTESVLRNMIDAGVVPIIAHPERNPVLRQKFTRVEAWVELGCLLQVTALSLTGGFGGAARIASYRLLDMGLVHFIASDTHDPENRHPRLTPARIAVESRCGQEVADILFSSNPRAVVDGDPLLGGKQISWRRPSRWYQFWK